MKPPKNLTPGPFIVSGKIDTCQIGNFRVIAGESGTPLAYVAWDDDARMMAASRKMAAVLNQLSEVNLTEENCASFEIANKRIRNLVRSALLEAGYTD